MKLTILSITLALLLPTTNAYSTPIHIYISDNVSELIFRSSLDGSNTKSILDSSVVQAPHGIALDIDQKNLYWTEPANGAIGTASLDGSTQSLIFTGNGTPEDLDIHAKDGKLYWIDSNGLNKIKRADIDGQNEETIFTAGSMVGVESIALDAEGGDLYFADPFDSKIKRANLDGTNVTDVFVGTTGTSLPDVAIDPTNGVVYWIEASVTRIRSALADGTSTGATTIVSNVNATSLTVDHSGTSPILYWAESTGRVFSLDLSSGSSSPILILDTSDGLSSPLGIVLGEPPPLTSDTTIEDPPAVTVDDSLNKITLTFETFGTPILNEAATFSSILKLVGSSPVVRYVATVTNKSNNLVRRVVSKNTSTTVKLKPGTYSANYKAHIVTGITQAKKLAKQSKLGGQISSLKKKPQTVTVKNNIQNKKVSLNLAGVKIRSTTNTSPESPEFTVN